MSAEYSPASCLLTADFAANTIADAMALSLQPIPGSVLPKAIPAAELKNKLGAVNKFVAEKGNALMVK